MLDLAMVVFLVDQTVALQVQLLLLKELEAQNQEHEGLLVRLGTQVFALEVLEILGCSIRFSHIFLHQASQN